MLEEKELIRKCKEDDLSAFEELIKNYEKRTYNVAYRILNSKEDAEDAAQEALLKVYKNIKNFKEESQFSTWLYRIVTNVCLDYLRKKKGKFEQSLDQTYDTGEGEVVLELAIDRETPESLYISEETRQIVITAMNELTPDYKAAIVLREIQGQTYEEIAEILDCSLGTVKSRINRARNHIKEKIKNKLEHKT